MLIDSHAHLDSARYDADREAMLKARTFRPAWSSVLSIGIGDGPDTMHRALGICVAVTQGRTDVPRLLCDRAGVHPGRCRQARTTPRIETS